MAAKQVIDMRVESIDVDLTEAEVLERAERLAAIADELIEHEAEEKETKAKLKGKKMLLEKERYQLSAAIRDKREPRSVNVNVVVDYVTDTTTGIDAETGEVLWERPSTQHERQMELGGYGEA